ncbi:MAG TPA: histidinol-phosphate transaminase [candidate division Zixibacteria bacterium]|nr:histidinol-phosphate transaminase [candidate division Zixibacteria bacterium]
MSQFLRPNVAELTPYVPGEQPRDGAAIKLNTNENPYPPSPRVVSALKKSIGRSLRLYPEPLADTLRAAAAFAYGVKAENVLAGNGSDELLAMLLRAFVAPGGQVAFPVPTYSLYDTLALIHGAEPLRVDYAPDFSLPPELFSRSAALTFLCNPNSPSGTLVPPGDIRRLARSLCGLLVVDEAYIDFAETEGASALPLIRELPNLIVLRTFSKSFSLAGMRIGLAFGPEALIAGLAKVKDSYNLNRLSIVAAAAALEDLPWMRRNARRIQRTRARMTRGLEKLGYQVPPSHANFVLARKPGRNLRGVYEALKARNILVRHFDVPALRDSLRISVGTPQEIEILLRELGNLPDGNAPV